MWIFSKFGFFSIVRHSKEGEDFQIRARTAQHLKNLRRRVPVKLSPTLKLEDADYRFRIPDVTPTQLNVVLITLAAELDYTNFKNSIKHDEAYHEAASRIWAEMHALQTRSLQSVDIQAQDDFQSWVDSKQPRTYRRRRRR
jgi:hypothetical protein